MEYSIDTANGTIYYVVKEDRVVITTYHGNDTEVVVPDKIDGVTVRKIGKKAFLNSRQLRRVVLPDTIKKLGEWAFAYCGQLECVEVPKRHVTTGKGCFLGDKNLKEIVLRQRKKAEDQSWRTVSDAYAKDIGILLAQATTMEDAEYLLDFKEAGSEEWLEKWDLRLKKFIAQPDEKGYTQMILCGEEDINCSLDNYVRDKRKRKARYCFARRLHGSGLTEETKKILDDYLISHSVGQPSMETWLILKEEKGHIREYYELYVNLGCLNKDNFDATLADLGEKQPEMKAYFMRHHEENRGEEDFFDSFML